MNLLVIDPGHGGADPGAVALGLKEKDLNLNISLLLKQFLENAGEKVLLTRETDLFLSLSQRASLANKEKAELFLSIHCNASPDPKAHGIELFYFPESASSQQLAEKLAQTLGFLERKMRGIKPGKFYLLKHTQMPACLLECGFITHPEEAEWLKNHPQQIAQAISEAILKKREG